MGGCHLHPASPAKIITFLLKCLLFFSPPSLFGARSESSKKEKKKNKGKKKKRREESGSTRAAVFQSSFESLSVLTVGVLPANTEREMFSLSRAGSRARPSSPGHKRAAFSAGPPDPPRADGFLGRALPFHCLLWTSQPPCQRCFGSLFPCAFCFVSLLLLLLSGGWRERGQRASRNVLASPIFYSFSLPPLA